MWFRFGFMDHLCAMGSVVATLLAVYHRDRTGIAQQVTGSLLGGGVLTNSETYLHEGGLAASVEPLDHEQMGLSPGYRLYALADGWIALCAVQEGELDRACAVVGARDPAELGRRTGRRFVRADPGLPSARRASRASRSASTRASRSSTIR